MTFLFYNFLLCRIKIQYDFPLTLNRLQSCSFSDLSYLEHDVYNILFIVSFKQQVSYSQWKIDKGFVPFISMKRKIFF